MSKYRNQEIRAMFKKVTTVADWKGRAFCSVSPILGFYVSSKRHHLPGEVVSLLRREINAAISEQKKLAAYNRKNGFTGHGGHGWRFKWSP